MKRLIGWMAPAAALLALALSANAQDDKEALKKKILESVEKKLKEEEERILKEVAKLIDDELGKGMGKKSDDKPKEDPPPAKKAGYLGIQAEEVSREECEELKIEGGVRVYAVHPDSPAQKGGVEEGDIIVEIDGEKILDFATLRPVLLKKGAGAGVTMKVLRSKKSREIKVTLGVHPEEQSRGVPEQRPKSDRKAEAKKTEEPSKDESSKTSKGDQDLRERLRKFLEKQK
ncbi:MAG: serine protease [Planctomycetes bacterium]|nr:serine protease [Planctomycetota bacterium]